MNDGLLTQCFPEMDGDYEGKANCLGVAKWGLAPSQNSGDGV
jgi:hypothetical protein